MMNKMIKMATIVAGIGAMLSFAGCGANTPEAVTLDVLQKLQNGKATADYLANNCTEESAQLFTMASDMFKMAMKDAKFSVVDTKIDGDKAVVTIKTEGGEMPGTEKYDLIKIDGKWKLNESGKRNQQK